MLNAILTSAERTDYINRIASLPERLCAAVAGLSDEQIDTPYRDGGWTVRQVVHHLADAHINGHIRTRLALTEEHPAVKPYDQDAWGLLADNALPIEPSLHILDGLHQRWSVLWKSLPESAYLRTVHHPDNGTMALSDILITYANHGDNHLKQITDLRQRKGW